MRSLLRTASSSSSVLALARSSNSSSLRYSSPSTRTYTRRPSRSTSTSPFLIFLSSVESDTSNSRAAASYLVNLEFGPYCTCPDFEKHERACKHVYAVQLLLQREDMPDGTTVETRSVRVSQPWAAYNAAQVHEGELFRLLLRELCDAVEQPPQTMGRPRMPLADMLYGMGLKVYSTQSTRRAMSDIRDAVAAGRMESEPSFNTPIRYFERPDVTPVLRDLIVASALPLRDLEVDFAFDSSGFASTAYHRWFDHKWETAHKSVQWVKLHVMCGVQTNIITVADATAGQSADSPYLPEFVGVTAENFRIREVSADMAYSSRRNLHAVDDVGGDAYIPFKKDAVAVRKDGSADPLWTKMYHLFTMQEAEFNRHYHKRSNVETVFHMLKAKFGERVRAKTPVAQVNEVLMKALCHNLSVLVHAMYALDVVPAFDPTGRPSAPASGIGGSTAVVCFRGRWTT